MNLVQALRYRAPLSTAAILLAAASFWPACRKAEAPAAETSKSAAPASPAKEAAAPGPSFRAAAEPGAAPFSGLHSPRGAALDDKGRLWVMSTGDAAIRVFDASGGLLGGWGGRGQGSYALRDPFDIAIRGDNVFVADTQGSGIELFSLSGEFRARADAGLFGPRGVAAGPDGRAWIADTGNDRVVLCEPNLANPRPIGGKGAGRENFSSPTGIVVGPSASVYVADAGNRRIQVLDAKGAFKASWKFNGMGPDSEPYLEVDDDETLYVTDSIAQVVVHLDRAGNEVKRWKQDDTDQKFARPTGIALDRKNRVLYVVNSDKDNVVKLKLSAK